MIYIGSSIAEAAVDEVEEEHVAWRERGAGRIYSGLYGDGGLVFAERDGLWRDGDGDRVVSHHQSGGDSSRGGDSPIRDLGLGIAKAIWAQGACGGRRS